ncbi:hypothetical protein D3C81_1924760 [compost metagenome]
MTAVLVVALLIVSTRSYVRKACITGPLFLLITAAKLQMTKRSITRIAVLRLGQMSARYYRRAFLSTCRGCQRRLNCLTMNV